MEKIIIISGKAGHGKDLTAKFLKECFNEMGKKTLVTHYADLLKYVCREFFGWGGEKDECGRNLLQKVGTDTIRKENPNYFVDFLAYMLGISSSEWDYILIPDCRFENEISRIKEKFGEKVVHVRVIRPNCQSKLTKEQQKHPSETSLDNYPADVTLLNTGTKEQYKNAVKNSLKEFLK